MRAVDTNVLVRLITRDSGTQTAVAESFTEKGAWVSHLVLAETAWVLSAAYQLGSEAIANGVQMLLDHQSLTIQDGEVVEAALVHYRAKPTIGFSDCLVLEIARKAGHLPLGTFDRALSKLPGAQRL